MKTFSFYKTFRLSSRLSLSLSLVSTTQNVSPNPKKIYNDIRIHQFPWFHLRSAASAAAAASGGSVALPALFPIG